MFETENYIIVSIGHTAAGKTSLLNFLSGKLKISCIEEGQIKRDLVSTTYSSKDSLDESLRDKAYKIAIDRAVSFLLEKKNIAIDASFHRDYRRLWVYEALNENSCNTPIVIWLYVFCNNEQKIRDRINNRYKSNIKTAKNQADKFYIYKHIINTFDKVSLQSFPDNFRNIILNVDTDENQLYFNSSNFCEEIDQPPVINQISSLIGSYLTNNKLKSNTQ